MLSEDDQVKATGNMYRKFWELWTHAFWEWTKKQTDRQTYRQVDCNTEGEVTKCADMLLERQQALELVAFWAQSVEYSFMKLQKLCCKISAQIIIILLTEINQRANFIIKK